MVHYSIVTDSQHQNKEKTLAFWRKNCSIGPRRHSCHTNYGIAYHYEPAETFWRYIPKPSLVAYTTYADTRKLEDKAAREP